MTDIPSPARGGTSATTGSPTRWLPLAGLWQGIIGLAGLAAMALLLSRLGSPPALLRGVLALLVGAAGLASLVSLPLIQRRDHRGRVLALVVNYLLFLALFFYLLHRIGLFNGIDALAGTFARGLPFLGIALLGYFVAGMGDAEGTGRARSLQRVGRGMLLFFGAAALGAMGLVPGLVALAYALIAGPLTVGLAGGALLCGLAAWFWWRDATGLAFGATIGDSEMLNGYLLLSPNLLGFLLFFAGPLLFSLYVSFTEWSAFGAKEWVGLANYQQIFSFDFARLAAPTQRASEVLAPRFVELARLDLFGQPMVIGAKDKLFWLSLRNTLLFALMVVPLSVLPALVLANILNSKIPGMRFFRALYFLPSVAAVVGVAVIWNWLYNSTTGFINYAIASAVPLLDALPGVTVSDPQVRWLSDSDTALFAIVLMSAWRIVGFNTVLFLAGLQGISKEIYEAADMDGAGMLRKFRSITIPLLAPTTFFVVTTTIIQALQLFDEVFVLMNPPAGPNNSTLTAVLYLYQNGFQRFNLGYASAVAWALFLVIFLVTLVQFRIQRSSEAY